MNSVKRFLSLIFYLISSLFILNAQISGYNLSTQVYQEFKDSKARIRTQNLVNSGENQFPFNVLVSFQSSIRTTSFSSKHLLFVIDQEQALKHSDTIKTIISSLEQKNFDFSTTILFTYDDTPSVIKKDMILGTEVYLNNANVNENTTAVILNFDTKKNEIITSSNGVSSPSFLVKSALNLFAKNNLETSFPTYYVSQQNKFKFFQDQNLDFFFKQEIPAIKLNFAIDTPQENITQFCDDFITTYSENKDFLWDQHFIIVKLFKSYKRMTERNIVHLIILLFFMCIMFIFLLGFVNANIKNKTWKRIRKIWFSAPIIFILILLGFFTGKGEYLIFASRLTYTGKIVFLFITQCLWSLLYCSIYFVIQIKKRKNLLSAKAIDFLIVFSSSLNLYIFSIIDISLFPVFLITLFFAILLLILSKKYLHIILFVLMIVSYIPYIHTIFNSADMYLFQKTFTENNFYFIAESLLLTPVILTYFRILISFQKKLKTYKKLIIATSIGYGCVMLLFGIAGFFTTTAYKFQYIDSKTITPIESGKPVTKIQWNDKKIFTDNVRTLKIVIPENTIQCDVEVSTDNVSPVLYSDCDYIMRTPTIAAFLIPSKPETQLMFTYGFSKPQSTITVNTIYFDELKDCYISNTIQINTGRGNE